MRRIMSFILAFIIGLSIWLCYVLSGYGWVREQWETSNGAFKVRVQYYNSFPLFKDAYYVFQSSPVGSDSWREVSAYTYDGFEGYVPMPSDQVRFVDGQTGNFFMYSLIAVTTDAGCTWTIWRPDKTVEDVRINPDGTGIAVLWDDYPLETQGRFIARTTDYGVHWGIE